MGGDGDNSDFVVLCDPPHLNFRPWTWQTPPALPFPLHLGGRTGEIPRLQTRGAARHCRVTGSDPLGEDTGGLRGELARSLQRTRAQCSHSSVLILTLPGAGSGQAGATSNSAEQTGRPGAPVGVCVTGSRRNLSAPRPSPGGRSPPTGLGSSALLRVHCVHVSHNRKLPSQQPLDQQWAPRPSQVNTRSQAPHRLQ